MCAASAAQAAWPTFAMIYFCRLVQGALSQFAWFLSLAFAASLGSVGGMSAVAWVMVGNSVGEVAGPIFGAALYAAGGFRLPYAASAGLALALSTALFASAGAEAPDSDGRLSSDTTGGRSAPGGDRPPPPARAAPQTTAAAPPAPISGVRAAAALISGVEAGGAPTSGVGAGVPAEGGYTAAVLSPTDAGEGGDLLPPPTAHVPPRQARVGALSDGRAVCLSLTLALCCGLVRSALDIVIPMWLRRQHGFGVSAIARASALATICFVGGSALSGRLLDRMAARR